MKYLNKKNIYLIILSAVLLFVFVVGLILTKKQEAQEQEAKKSYLIPRENVSREFWERQLELENINEKTIIKNIYDGYQIEIPNDWQYSDLADPIGGFISYKLKEGVITDIYRGFDDGVLLSIHTVSNPKKMSSVDWLARSDEPRNYLLGGLTFEKMEHPNESGVYKSSYPIFAIESNEVYESIPQNPSEALVANSLKLNYIFSNKNKIYIVSCGISGTGYSQLINECEEIIQTFKILD